MPAAPLLVTSWARCRRPPNSDLGPRLAVQLQNRSGRRLLRVLLHLAVPLHPPEKQRIDQPSSVGCGLANCAADLCHETSRLYTF
mmetsp:Transcript_20797/g.71824  ORF Transcript_20797/g.71824 Transcript_20797/m.71824 type:complete len:85 (-) Transcript_20797:84-338(-)